MTSPTLRALLLAFAVLFICVPGCDDSQSSPTDNTTTDALDNEVDGVLTDDATNSDPDANTSGCTPTSTFFETNVWPFLGTTCFVCHGNQGIGALNSDLDLIAVTQPADHLINLATLRAVASEKDDNTSILLLKPTGIITHGGGSQITEDSAEYAALVDLVGRFDDPPSCDDPATPDTTLSSLEVTANTLSVRVGRSVPLSVLGRNAQGGLVALPDDLQLSTDNSSIARIDPGNLLRGLAEGRVAVTAQSGDILSAALSFDVLPPAAQGVADLRVYPARVVLSLTDTLGLGVEVRDDLGERILSPEITWQVTDPTIAEISAEGVVSALALGQTTAIATFEGSDSLPIPILVTDQDTYLAVDITTPSSDTSATATLSIDVDVQWLFPSSPNSFGTPTLPTLATALINGQPAADLSPHFFGASGDLDLSGYPDGPLVLEVEAEADGERARSPAITILKNPAPQAVWQDLGPADGPTWETVYGQHARMWTVDGTLYSAVNRCDRECSLNLFSFNVSENRWNPIDYTQRHFRDLSGVLEERIVERNNIDLAYYVGWGWISTNAREAYTPTDIGSLTIAWSNRDARTSFNTEDEPEHFWNDCYVARWDNTAGYDGAGGWRIFSTENPAWQDEPPHPDTLPTERSEQRFPSGADAVRAEDCSYPKLGVSGQNHLLAFVATPIPNNDWKLRLRSWSNNTWTDATQPLPLSTGAVLHDMLIDSSGQPIVAVDQGGQRGRVLRLDGSDWQPLGVSPSVSSIARLPNDVIVTAGALDGDLVLNTFDGQTWTPLGGPLDIVDWTHVQEVSLATQGDRIAVAWSEGPDRGAWNVFVAVWRPDSSAWEVIGDGPFELNPDAHATSPFVLIDEAGYLTVRYAAPNDDLTQHPWIQRVRRTQSPVF